MMTSILTAGRALRGPIFANPYIVNSMVTVCPRHFAPSRPWDNEDGPSQMGGRSSHSQEAIMISIDDIEQALRQFAQGLSRSVKDIEQAAGFTSTKSQSGKEHGQA